MECATEFLENHKIGIAVGFTSVLGLFLLKQYARGGQCRSKAKLTGKTVLVTGASAGIGKETARDFAKRGARVLMACRDLAKSEKVAQEIRETTGNQNVVVYKLDLSSLESVRACAEEVKKNEKRLDILVNNAGVTWLPFLKSADGFEMQFATNHLGHFLFTNLLLDLLKKSAPSRIVTVASSGHSFVNGIEFDNLNGEKSYHKMMTYCQSKLANVLFSRELSRRLKGTGVTSNSLNPGAVATEMSRYLWNWSFYVRWPLLVIYYGGMKYMIKSSKDGAQTSIYLAVSDEVENVTGKYFSDCAVKDTSPAGEDDEMAARLWAVSEKMTGLK